MRERGKGGEEVGGRGRWRGKRKGRGRGREALES